ncbi:unnamed protein product [Musa acuminata subsp. malaccensis]|uniref:4-coumarate--CoA ligase n=1 Tax=Musa acuminata subsp. malaccensis TaxID=214687 RepID=A0A8D7FLP3_MUSAM|nr:unnamed protein product [Musa acuminata subsp. malaccensis]
MTSYPRRTTRRRWMDFDSFLLRLTIPVCSPINPTRRRSPPSTKKEQRNAMDGLGPNAANSCPVTPLEFLERTATVYGDCPSLVYNRTAFTWSQTLRRCLRLASALSSLGISPGDVVSVLAPNVPAMYEMHFGVPMSGAVLNTVNLRLDARTISILLRHSASKLVFVDVLSRPLLDDVLRLFPASAERPRVVTIEDPYEDAPPPQSSALTYEKLLETGDPEFRWVRPRSEWDPMVLNYTSGTTSAPKGVVHCHRGLFFITIDSLIDWSVPRRPTYLWTLPMFHANGWSYPWGIAAAGGVNVCLRRFDAAAIYAAIETHRVTHMCGAPVVLNMLANAPDSARRPLHGPVQVLTAGAPPPAAVLDRTEALGFAVSHGYGLTETAGLRGGGVHPVRPPSGERGGGGGATGRVLGGDAVRVRQPEGGSVGGATDGERGDRVVPRAHAALHGAEDGGAPGGAAEDVDGEDTEVRAEGDSQEDGLRRSAESNVVHDSDRVGLAEQLLHLPTHP